MLVLSRKTGEAVFVGSDIRVKVLEVRGDRVKLGLDGPPELPIHREEVYRALSSRPPALESAECA
jgi:carbon storage regulator